MASPPRWARVLVACALTTALTGCISFGPEPPDSLLTLTPSLVEQAGAGSTAQASAALTVLEPTTSQRLAVTRVPVKTSASTLAYLESAFWVEKPSMLFRTLLTQTIRARGNRLVVGSGELEYAAATQLSGDLVDMGYDVPSGSAIVRFDAVLAMPGGEIRTRRFESSVPGIAPEANAVGAALNQAANAVAVEVADWVR